MNRDGPCDKAVHLKGWGRSSKSDTKRERYMNNVRPLFPNATDEEWEDHMMPVLIEAMGLLYAAADAGDHEILCEISTSLLEYVYTSLETLDAIRRSGHFDDNRLPLLIARVIDDLAADYIKAKGADDSFAEKFRTRSPTKRANQLGKEWLN